MMCPVQLNPPPINSIANDTKKKSQEHEKAWFTFLLAGQTQKKAAFRALKILILVHSLKKTGWKLDNIINTLKSDHKISRPTLMRWHRITKNLPQEHWLAYLVPGKTGPKSPHYNCSEDAWVFIMKDWLRPKKPSLSASYYRVKIAAEQHGWIIPSKKTFSRWFAQFPKDEITLAREPPGKPEVMPDTKQDSRLLL